MAKSKKPLSFLQEGAPLGHVQVQNDLGIGLGMKPVAFGHQLLAQLLEVEDFAVEDDGVAARLIGHGLVAVGREVENGEAAETQAAPIEHEMALGIRPAAYNGVG